MLANDQEDMERSPGRKPDGPNPAGRSFVIAVDRKTGQTRWQTETKTFLAGYSTPCVYQAEGGRAELIFSTTAHGIMAVDPATGKSQLGIRAAVPGSRRDFAGRGPGPGDRGPRGGDPRDSLHRRAAGLGRAGNRTHSGLSS